MSHLERPSPAACLPATLQGRDSAPTGVPAGAAAPVGEEGTPAAQVQAHNGRAPQPLAEAGVLLRMVTGLLPALVVRVVSFPDPSWLSIDLNKEGLFLFLKPVEVALVYPWVKL